FRCLLPSTGSLGLVPPRFLGTVKHSDFLPPFPRCFVSFASRYRRCALGFVPAAARRNSCGPGVIHRIPHPGFIDGGDRTSQVPGGPRCERALLSDPGGTSALGHCRASVLSSAKWKASTPTTNTNFGTQSHGLCTRCLRFAGWITPPPRKTRFRMAGPPCPGGSDYPLGPTERFQVIHPPFPGFTWRTQI